MILRHKHSRVSDPNSFKTSSGSKLRISFSSHFNNDGTISLSPSGSENIQDRINSYLAQTDMALIVSRLQLGDTSVLSSRRAFYGDFTQFPKTYAEAFDLVQRSEQAFEQLPIDVKSAFDNDRGKWFASIGSPDWLTAMGFVKPASVESEVAE